MELAVELLAGGKLNVLAPVFTGNGENVVVAWKNVLQSYNSKTAKLIREYVGATARIFAFYGYFKDNCEHLVACSATGHVVAWMAENGLQVFRKDLHCKQVHSFNIIGRRPLVLVSECKNECIPPIFYTLDLKKGKRTDLELEFNGRTRAKGCLVATSHDYFAIVNKHKLFMVRYGSKSVFSTGIKAVKFTCVTCHPSEEYILTGDSLGRVLLWSNFGDGGTYAVYHWHSQPVLTVRFSHAGSYFYSGGSENVLVQWDADDVYRKKFLPRMSAEIRNITVGIDNSYIAVATGDNAVQILDPQFRNVCVIQHFVTGGNLVTRVTYDRYLKNVILNGLPGHLQFFSMQNGNLLYNLDITGQNRVTGEPDLVCTEVTKVAVDDRGQWLATVEAFAIKDCFETRLKFWLFDSQVQRYSLHTCIEYPHEQEVLDLSFRPSQQEECKMCATIGGREFRIWKLEEMEERGTIWSRYRVGYFRNFAPNTLAFSSDGSLLGVGFDSIVTAWVPESCESKCTLSHHTNKAKLQYLAFGIANDSHLLVATTKKIIYVWNLLTLSISWTIRTSNIACLISDPSYPRMGLFTATDVYLFSPSTPKLIHKQSLRLVKNVKTATFICCDKSPRGDKCQIVAINDTNSLYRFGNDEDENGLEENEKQQQQQQQGLFASTLAKVKTDLRTKGSEQLSGEPVPRHTGLKKLLDVPVQTMPPVLATCETLLNTIVLERKLYSVSSAL